MRQYTTHICIDCGKEFLSCCDHQVRCHECQREHRRAYDRERYHRTGNRRRQKNDKTKTKSMVVNGHVQICTHMGSCFYGQSGQEGCSYVLEHGVSRRSQGLWIVDGKCPAYRPKKRGDVLKRQKLVVPHSGAELKEILKEYTEV